MNSMRALFALAALAAAEGQNINLDQIRRINLERAANLPNFVADEVVTHYSAKKYTGPSESAPWRREHVFTAEITARDAQISRRNVLRDGKPWNKKLASAELSASMPATGFGAFLTALFDPQCPTTLTANGAAAVRGKSALLYLFTSPADGCFGNLYGGWGYNAARTGRVFIDDSTGDVLQFEEEATGFPRGFSFTQRNQTMTWNIVRIGTAAYWLPVFADFIWKRSDGSLTRSTAEYKNHRHFEAESNFLVK